MGRLGEVPAALVIVYASVRYDLPSLLDAIREVTGATPLVGASTTGHFHDGQITEPGRGVAVLVLSSGRYEFTTGSATGLTADGCATGQALAKAARQAAGEQTRQHTALLVLSCGLTGDQQQLINGIYRVLGAAVPIVGGASSDDRRMQQTFVFHNGTVLTDAAVAVWIGSDNPITILRAHGWQTLGLPLPITGVDGFVVRSIAGRPAREVFNENVDQARADASGPAATAGPAPGEPVRLLGEAGRCFGLIEPDGSRLLRGCYVGDENEIRTWVPLPPYAAVQVMACTQDDLLEACDEIAHQALAGSEPPAVLLAFSCIARLGMLHDRVGEEAARLQAAMGEVTTFGFYTYGEFARTTSIDGVHNATITALAL